MEWLSYCGEVGGKTWMITATRVLVAVFCHDLNLTKWSCQRSGGRNPRDKALRRSIMLSSSTSRNGIKGKPCPSEDNISSTFVGIVPVSDNVEVVSIVLSPGPALG